ncbi:Transmembrane transcriptional regulator (anti-sigma factor RsiW) [Duganella sp. CF458]|uniref:anti-sigma factor family protein n=1 Tax=Duganella sp. CF458 TaxID=1884368 RepID=UPI0008EFFD92|nr:anti-sigma factor [Duganella sp. CF458]SFG18894.1 Transmembrane transcriptional regulator (anti-sigma factor RsiW) [Duganella sp. CF458]
MNEAELHAWVDGRLPPERQATVERYLADHPAEAARLQAYRAQNAALHALFDEVLDARIPAALHPSARPAQANAAALTIPAWRRMAAMLAVAIGAGVIGGAAGWTLRGAGPEAGAALAASGTPSPLAALPRQAAIAHAVYTPEVKHPVEVGADQQQHLVAWLSKRLGKQLRPPQLAQQGYELVGGRLLPGDAGPVAQFMYTDTGGQRLTLYVSSGQKQNRDTGFRFAQEGNVGVFYWIDGSFGYALSAAVGKNELSQIANAVYEQLQPN